MRGMSTPAGSNTSVANPPHTACARRVFLLAPLEVVVVLSSPESLPVGVLVEVGPEIVVLPVVLLPHEARRGI